MKSFTAGDGVVHVIDHVLECVNTNKSWYKSNILFNGVCAEEAAGLTCYGRMLILVKLRCLI